MYIFEDTILKIKNNINQVLNEIIDKNELKNVNIPKFEIEPPTDESHGDLYSNVALLCAKTFKMAPVKIAQIIVSGLKCDNLRIQRVEIAGPGFINFFLSQDFFSDALSQIKDLGTEYGKNNFGKNKKVMIEFVSANPTGPMHMGNARLGALGDCLAETLKASGYEVYKEFYVNDAGNQIEKFGASLDVRYRQLCLGEDAVEMPENGYHGGDITDRAREFFDLYGEKYIEKEEKERTRALVDFALPKNISQMQSDLKKYKIIYDNWFYESTLHNQGEVKKVIDLMKQKNLTYEKDGSLWYKAKEFGSEKDEVLIRSNGVPTYFAADIAYHYNKFVTRGFDICINIWGADHHGHVERMKNAMEAIGISRDRLHIILVQLVRLVKNGEVVRMSKRSGKSVQLYDLIEEVGADSARFIFNTHEAACGMDFDLDLAVAQDSKNPVYYVQYAHARICSILRRVQKEYDGLSDLNLLSHESEKKLIYFMALYPGVLLKAAKGYDPSKITRYAINLATLFHKWYSSCKIVSKDIHLTASRLTFCKCVGIMIKSILDSMKVEAPEFMD